MPSSIIFVKKITQRCGVWQNKRIYDITGPGSSVHEIKHIRFWGLFTNKVLKMQEIGQEGKFWVWFGLLRLSLLLGLDPF